MMSDGSDTVPSWLISNHKAEKKIGKDKNYIHILVDNRSDDFVSGGWQLKLSVDNPDPDEVVSVNFHAWVERNLGNSQAVFADLIDSDLAYTVNGIGNLELRKKSSPTGNSVGVIAVILTNFGNNRLVYKKIDLPYSDLN
jgi:hypothetical protein